MSYRQFCEKIRLLCLAYHISITSWWRSEKRNKDEGGNEKSKHLRGLAVDCVLDDEKFKPNFLAAVKNFGLVWKDEGDHIHVQVPFKRKSS